MNMMKKKLEFRINISSIIIVFTVFIAMRLESIRYILPFSRIYYALSLLILMYYIVLTIFEKKTSVPVVMFFIFFGIYLLSTFLNTGIAYIYPAMRNVTSPLLLVIIFDRYMRKKPYGFLKLVYILLIALVVIDLIAMWLYPDGMYITEITNYKNNWVLGYKSARVRSTAITLIAIAGVLDISEFNKLKSRFLFAVILSIIDTVLSRATAGTITILLEAALIVLFFHPKREKIRKTIIKLFNIRVLLLLIFVLNIIFVILQNFANNRIVSYILIEILDKDLTFTHRTQIWSSSMQQFLRKPIIGSGYMASEEFIRLTLWRGGTQPHNLMLALLVYTGIIGFLLYVYILMYFLKKTNDRGRSLSSICAIAIIVNLIFGITTMNMFGQYHYAMMVMLYYLSKHENSGSLIVDYKSK